MGVHVLHDVIALEVRNEAPDLQLQLAELLRDLSFVETVATPDGLPHVTLTVSTESPPSLPAAISEPLGNSRGLSMVRQGKDLYVEAGASVAHLDLRDARATGYIASSFCSHPAELRQRFWAFTLLKLLRCRRLFGLHAAAVVTPTGDNLLLIGPSGCGKSTLTIDLIRAGGRYLSDDSILLRALPDGVEALALRKPFSIDGARVLDYSDIVIGPPPRNGSGKRRADIQAAFPRQHLTRFRPTALVMPRIVLYHDSTIRRIERSAALGYLIAQSGPELFDDLTMPAQLAVLAALLKQATPYELCAGRDLRQSPGRFTSLLHAAAQATVWPALSSN